MPWEIFRARHLPGRSHQEAIAQGAFWARHHGIRLRFVQREVDGATMSTPIIMLLLEPVGP